MKPENNLESQINKNTYVGEEEPQVGDLVRYMGKSHFYWSDYGPHLRRPMIRNGDLRRVTHVTLSDTGEIGLTIRRISSCKFYPSAFKLIERGSSKCL